MLFRVLGFTEEITGEGYLLVRKQLHHLWLNWKKNNIVADEEELRFEQLVEMFYTEFGFSGNWQDYFNSDNLLLPKVMDSHSGNSTALAILFIYFARKFDLDIDPISFPSQLILLVDSPKGGFYFDPFTGKVVSKAELELKLRGIKGNLTVLEPKYLEAISSKQFVKRWLMEIKAGFIREENFESALKVCAVLLKLKPGDPDEVRDRGFIYQQLECFNMAISDYEYFIDQRPDDPLSKILKHQITELDSQALTLH
ncbi:SirB1 family protein [Alginatibacterium sediminis]|uniref:SirB1 family protein n=1 Tax=Alginatibacterium sediminis TaxID=2164068 RepID=UPI0013144400|nr:tetratricopeptide repeat protein [Alginatibacterium sediminis]